MATSLSPETVTTWRTENLGYLLFTARDRCIGDKLTLLHERGFGAMTDAQLALFHHLDQAGSRLTDIASSAGLTPSSVSELVARAVSLGLVERVPDEDDRRAKRVRYTAAGNDFLDHLNEAIQFADQRFAVALGDDAMQRAIAALVKYGGVTSQGANVNIGRLLAGTAKRFVRHVLDSVHARGDPDVGEPQLNMFRALGLHGSRLTDLAARAGVTKQSMRETVGGAAGLGLVALHPDPQDGRARQIVFTDAGLAMLESFRCGVVSAEDECAKLLGDRALANLRGELKVYIAFDQAKLRPTNQ